MLCDVDEALYLSLKMLKRHQPYGRYVHRDDRQRDVIGYGRELHEAGISQSEAEVLLQRDAISTQEFLANFPFWSKANAARKAALTDLCVFFGPTLFSWQRELIRFLNAEDYFSAAELLRAAWDGQPFKTRLLDIAELVERGKVFDL